MKRPEWVSQFEATLRAYPPRRRALVGVSGGCDSVSLLRLLAERGYTKLTVCHLHHGLRGRAADADARFVQRLATTARVEFELDRTNVRQLAEDHGLSLEAAGRAARLRFFTRIARERRIGVIFLAHHADDQVETFLHRLLRGSGARGLSAMNRETTWGSLKVVRPLLHVGREEIESLARANAWKWREDASNLDLAHTRNRIRHQMLPAMAEIFGRDIRPALWRAAEILRADDEWLTTMVSEALAISPDHLSVGALRSMPLSLQRRLIAAWLGQFVDGIEFSHVETARALLEPDHEGHPAKSNLPRDFHVRRSAGRLWVQPPLARVGPART